MENISLSLFVAGNDAESRELIDAVNRVLCQSSADDKYFLEVVDVLDSPEKALERDIFATPTLVRNFPLPVVKLIGDVRRSTQLMGLLQFEKDQLEE